MNKQIEILSPAGSYESMVAAIHAGADAIYIGGTRFGARAFADNLQEQQLLDAIDYVHLHGRKIYLTVNTLLKEQELEHELFDYLLPFYKHGIDAVIVQDIGVLEFVKYHFPDLPIHASTQMTVTSVSGAKFVEKLGVERVVTAREMSLSEIKEIAENTKLEIESFVHGALCYCYSGQCLYSSLIGGRSGNRGQCAQPCRLPYKVQGSNSSQYILSLKDMCTLDIIPDLIEAGIHSFKIEGRMKKPEYVALVTAMYRKYTDLFLLYGRENYRVEPEDREMLMDLYNRGGSHDGYYFTHNGREMISLSRPNHAGVPALKVLSVSGKSVTFKTLVDIHKGDVIELPDGKEIYTFSSEIKKGEKSTFYTHNRQIFDKNGIIYRIRNEQLLTEIRSGIIENKLQEKVFGRLELYIGQPAKLYLEHNECKIEVFGDIVQEAVNQPMPAERIEKQMRKTGNTPFTFESITVNHDERIFIPLQSLNELRRNGLEMLIHHICAKYRRNYNKKADLIRNIQNECTDLQVAVYVESLEQLIIALDYAWIGRIYFDCNSLQKIWENPQTIDIISRVHKSGKQIYLAMPHVLRSATQKIYEKHAVNLFELEWDGYLIRNLESYTMLHEWNCKRPIVTDYNLYQFNSSAKNFWINANIESTTAPVELNYHELKDVGLEKSELIIYGYLPMMISAQCVKRTVDGCKKIKGELEFTDRYHKTFTVKNNCDYCYNVIYNTMPLALADQKHEIADLQPKALRLNFTIENSTMMRQVLDLYEQVFILGKDITPEFEFTRGHFKRGIK